MKLKEQEQEAKPLPSFETRALSALGISIAADVLDYIGAPVFSIPIVGDIADGIVISLLYSITKSKTSTTINAIEFIPFIGDFVPAYTLSTLMWIYKESRERRKRRSNNSNKETDDIDSSENRRKRIRKLSNFL
jgi:hypothetical protein